MSDSDSTFLSRWSRRKAAVREGQPVPDEAPVASDPATVPQVGPQANSQAAPQTAPQAAQPPVAAETPPPTLADVALLQPGDNIARFVARGVDETVKRAALKTLFADPHFNVMDGLDTYIDDYGKPDPIPPEVLRQLRQSETLGLFAPLDEEAAANPAARIADVADIGDTGDTAEPTDTTDTTDTADLATPLAATGEEDSSRTPQSPDAAKALAPAAASAPSSQDHAGPDPKSAPGPALVPAGKHA
ncbi:Protein of unknown function [Cupriavidus sp. YR651]|uniref:DUF3306 domain-containing protein n=1 Tax=Cupriavidus sp. YR651 TaxID=1855315 RepID=UPI0008850D3E|nr:DUF3306 domain-containing protein [Cupriavidus sp. YR651]SDC23314.1 Protein of unknown function [Cupriavidus sp. YR651]